MARKPKGVHTSPEKAGVQNMPKGYEDKNKDELNTMEAIMPIYNKGRYNLEAYKGLWDDESLIREVGEYLQYCTDQSVKPSKAGLRVWLGISRSQYHAWESDKAKYGSKSDILRMANDVMEISYIERAESYPTANIFLLKTSHGHTEVQKVDITSSAPTTSEEIDDLVSKLGLNNPKSE